MKKPNSENLSKAKSLENDEMTQKEDQKEDKKENKKENQKEEQKEDQEESEKRSTKEESKNFLISINGSQEQEDNLDIFPQKDSNSKLYDEIENFYDNQKHEEPKSFEETEINEKIKKESEKNDFQQEDTEIITSKQESENSVIITISLYKQKIQKIIHIKPKIFFKKKKKYMKKEFYELLKLNSLGKYIEKIEFALKEEESDSGGMISYEDDENFLNNNTSETSWEEYLASLNINEIISEDNTSEISLERPSLVKSLIADMENHGIFTSSSSFSITNEE